MRGWILLACLGLAADFSLACPFADSGARGELQFHDRAHMLADLVNSKNAGWRVRPRSHSHSHSHSHSLERSSLLYFLFYCSLLFAHSYVDLTNKFHFEIIFDYVYVVC